MVGVDDFGFFGPVFVEEVVGFGELEEFGLFGWGDSEGLEDFKVSKIFA